MQLASLEQSITKVQTDRPACERGHAPPRGAPPVPVVSAPLQLQPSMPGAALRVLYIQGVTLRGKSFRPSDWAERLAGAMSSFRPKGPVGGISAHIGYSPYCVPRVVDGIKCVMVNEALRDIEPMAWDFVMNFASDNELVVADARRDGLPGHSACTR